RSPGEMNLAAKENAPRHADAVRVESIAHRLVAKEVVRQHDQAERKEDASQEVVNEQPRARPLDGEDLFFVHPPSLWQWLQVGQLCDRQASDERPFPQGVRTTRWCPSRSIIVT